MLTGLRRLYLISKCDLRDQNIMQRGDRMKLNFEDLEMQK